MFGLGDFELPTDGSVEAIGSSVFAGKTFENTDIVLPASIKRIGSYAFEGSNITSIVFEGVESIDDGAFGMCQSLVSVTFSATLTYVGYDLLYECENIEALKFKGETPPEGLENTYFYYNSPTFYVPSETAKTAYQAVVYDTVVVDTSLAA
jgi:hypothetical protein